MYPPGATVREPAQSFRQRTEVSFGFGAARPAAACAAKPSAHARSAATRATRLRRAEFPALGLWVAGVTVRRKRGASRSRAEAGRLFKQGRSINTSTRIKSRAAMATVREATYDLLRERGMTTIFGNPGSTELPMLAGYPDDFRYVLGLQEIVAVGMADGHAQASGRPAHVNLHTAPGMGNGVGAIFNAQANKAPLLITAGQQARSLMTLQANLTNRDAVRVPEPFVKWSYEPPRAEDVPHAIARAVHVASLPPRGPAFVSIPMDDWGAEVDEDAVRHQTGRDRKSTRLNSSHTVISYA